MDGVISMNKELIEALDALALALTDHNHQWTNKERKLYEKAILILR